MKSAFQEFNRIDGQIQRSYHEAAVKMGLPDSEFWMCWRPTSLKCSRRS